MGDMDSTFTYLLCGEAGGVPAHLPHMPTTSTLDLKKHIKPYTCSKHIANMSIFRTLLNLPLELIKHYIVQHSTIAVQLHSHQEGLCT